MTPLPGKPLVGVVGGPDVEWAQGLDDPVILGREVVGDLGPGPDPDPVGLGDAAVLEQRPRRRFLVRPDPLLERPAELGMMRLADQVVALMVERGVEEELVVLDLEVLVLLPDPTLAEGDELLALGQGADRHGPLFESDRHRY